MGGNLVTTAQPPAPNDVTGTRWQHSYQAVTCAVIIQVTNVVPAT